MYRADVGNNENSIGDWIKYLNYETQKQSSFRLSERGPLGTRLSEKERLQSAGLPVSFDGVSDFKSGKLTVTKEDGSKIIGDGMVILFRFPPEDLTSIRSVLFMPLWFAEERISSQAGIQGWELLPGHMELLLQHILFSVQRKYEANEIQWTLLEIYQMKVVFLKSDTRDASRPHQRLEILFLAGDVNSRACFHFMIHIEVRYVMDTLSRINYNGEEINFQNHFHSWVRDYYANLAATDWESFLKEWYFFTVRLDRVGRNASDGVISHMKRSSNARYIVQPYGGVRSLNSEPEDSGPPELGVADAELPEGYSNTVLDESDGQTQFELRLIPSVNPPTDTSPKLASFDDPLALSVPLATHWNLFVLRLVRRLIGKTDDLPGMMESHVASSETTPQAQATLEFIDGFLQNTSHRLGQALQDFTVHSVDRIVVCKQGVFLRASLRPLGRLPQSQADYFTARCNAVFHFVPVPSFSTTTPANDRSLTLLERQSWMSTPFLVHPQLAHDDSQDTFPSMGTIGSLKLRYMDLQLVNEITGLPVEQNIPGNALARPSVKGDAIFEGELVVLYKHLTALLADYYKQPVTIHDVYEVSKQWPQYKIRLFVSHRQSLTTLPIYVTLKADINSKRILLDKLEIIAATTEQNSELGRKPITSNHLLTEEPLSSFAWGGTTTNFRRNLVAPGEKPYDKIHHMAGYLTIAPNWQMKPSMISQLNMATPRVDPMLDSEPSFVTSKNADAQVRLPETSDRTPLLFEQNEIVSSIQVPVQTLPSGESFSVHKSSTKQMSMSDPPSLPMETQPPKRPWWMWVVSAVCGAILGLGIVWLKMKPPTSSRARLIMESVITLAVFGLYLTIMYPWFISDQMEWWAYSVVPACLILLIALIFRMLRTHSPTFHAGALTATALALPAIQTQSTSQPQHQISKYPVQTYIDFALTETDLLPIVKFDIQRSLQLERMLKLKYPKSWHDVSVAGSDPMKDVESSEDVSAQMAILSQRKVTQQLFILEQKLTRLYSQTPEDNKYLTHAIVLAIQEVDDPESENGVDGLDAFRPSDRSQLMKRKLELSAAQNPEYEIGNIPKKLDEFIAQDPATLPDLETPIPGFGKENGGGDLVDLVDSMVHDTHRGAKNSNVLDPRKLASHVTTAVLEPALDIAGPSNEPITSTQPNSTENHIPRGKDGRFLPRSKANLDQMDDTLEHEMTTNTNEAILNERKRQHRNHIRRVIVEIYKHFQQPTGIADEQKRSYSQQLARMIRKHLDEFQTLPKDIVDHVYALRELLSVK